MSHRQFVFLAGLFLCSCGDGPGTASDGTGQNVVLITVDTLRADHLGCYGYFRPTSPRIDALASESVLFENCTVPMATTLPSHVSILTGTWPIEHGVLANVAHGGMAYKPTNALTSLSQALTDCDYATAAFVSAKPLRLNSGIDKGFSHFDDPNAPQRRGAVTADRAIKWLAQHLREKNEQPFFLWVHLFDPHDPFDPPSEYSSAFKAGAGLEAYLQERGFSDASARPGGRMVKTRESHDGYDGEILYTDEQVGHLLDELDRQGIRERTIVSLITDHGEGLGQHAEPGHGLIWDEQVRSAWLLRAPGLSARRVTARVSTVDFLPTLLELLQLPELGAFREQLSGVDVLAASFRGRPQFSQSSARLVEHGQPLVHSVSQGPWKLHWQDQEHRTLYNLETDPFELKDVAASHPERVEELQEILLEHFVRLQARSAKLGAAEEIVLDPSTLKALQDLGYTGAEQDD